MSSWAAPEAGALQIRAGGRVFCQPGHAAAGMRCHAGRPGPDTGGGHPAPYPLFFPELAALAQETGRICRRDFDPPQVLSCKGMTTLLFCEKPALRAVFGSAGTAAKGTVSGDAVQQFCSPAAAQMILCDGMGTGRPAAVDGSLAAELTARLLKAGFTAELAARLVNVALALKSDEESGATLDLISVDLYTGTARIFKAGAAPGFLVHGAAPVRWAISACPSAFWAV